MRFDEDWSAHDGVFGGYVVARLVQEAERSPGVEGYATLSISVQFMGAVRPGDCSVRTEVAHAGALTAAVAVDLLQGHRRASAAVKLGRPLDAPLLEQRLDLSGEPRPEDLAVVAMPYGPYAYERHLQTRLIPDPRTPWRERVRAWVRMAPEAAGRLTPCAAASVFLDMAPPGLFFADRKPVFVPTVDFTAHFAPPSRWAGDEWLYLVQETRWATRDFCLEEARLHAADGGVVAQAVQTRRVRWPEGRPAAEGML